MSIKEGRVGFITTDGKDTNTHFIFKKHINGWYAIQSASNPSVFIDSNRGGNAFAKDFGEEYDFNSDAQKLWKFVMHVDGIKVPNYEEKVTQYLETHQMTAKEK